MSDQQSPSHNQSLRQTEQVFKLLVDSVQDYAIFMLDPHGIVSTWNEGAERIKGYRASEIIGRHFSIFYPEEANARKHPDYELKMAISEGRYQEEGWRLRKDGSQLWANVTITPVYDGNTLIGFAKVTRDLTERRESEQREEVFRLLVSGVKDYAIFMLSPEGNVLTWNDGAERIQGYSAEEIIGKHFSVFYTREAQKRAHPQKELETATAAGRYEEEGWRLRKDGSLLWASVVITPIFVQEKLIGFAKVTRDLTQRLLSDQEREASAQILDDINNELRKALDVKSTFLSTISHEVRTPMSGIIGMTEMLAAEDLGEDNNFVVQNIFDMAKRLLQLLNNLLDSARMESGELTLEERQFPIRVVLGDVRQMVMKTANEKRIKLVGSCDSRTPEMVCGDEMKLRQVLLNLVHNAVKFTESGEVSLSAEVNHRGVNQLTMRFSVRDTGIGIKPEDREKLFKPFSQADDATKRVYGGSGLGLSISKQLVELMGGTMNFESEFGKGSHFWCDIPFTLKPGAANV
ncbi:MAG: PAS domain S-box protein [Cyanobacteria bacterium SZAS-4]|nr:PAS domain S-box protein [Cyanobacteria bacterium SZAS-4]